MSEPGQPKAVGSPGPEPRQKACELISVTTVVKGTFQVSRGAFTAGVAVLQ